MQLTSLTLGPWKVTANEKEIRLHLDSVTIAIPAEHVADLIAALMMTNPGEQPKFLNLQETADTLGKGRTSVRRATELDRVPGMIKMGDGRGILAAAVDHIDFGRPGNPAWLKDESDD